MQKRPEGLGLQIREEPWGYFFLEGLSWEFCVDLKGPDGTGLQLEVCRGSSHSTQAPTVNAPGPRLQGSPPPAHALRTRLRLVESGCPLLHVTRCRKSATAARTRASRRPENSLPRGFHAGNTCLLQPSKHPISQSNTCLITSNAFFKNFFTKMLLQNDKPIHR